MTLNRIRKILNRFSGTQFGDVLKGSSVYSLAKIVATALGFGGSVLIGHFYNAEVIGKIATMSSIFTLLTLVALLGTESYVLRSMPTLLAKFGGETAFRVYLKVASLVGVVGITIVTAAAIFLPKSPTLFKSIENFQLLLFGLIFATALKKISLSTLRSMGDYKVFSIFEILPSLFMILAVSTSVLLAVGDEAFIYIYYAPHFLLAVLVFLVVRKGINKRKRGTADQDTQSNPISAPGNIPTFLQMLTISVPMLGVNLSNAAIAHTDILMLSSFTNEETVGIFSIYVKISALMSLGIAATNSMYAPKASRLFDAGKIEELGVLTRQTTTFILVIALVSFTGILIIHDFVLGLYGPEFFNHLPALYILLLALLANAAFGAVGILLNMTGQQKYFFKIILSAAIMNAVANYFMIPMYGPVGAAVSTLLTILYWNTMAVLRVKKIHGFVTFPKLSLNLKQFKS